MFHSQKKYLFEVPSSIVFNRKLDTALRKSSVLSFYNRRDENRLTNDDKLITESYHYKELVDDFYTTRATSTLAYTDILDQIILDTDQGTLYDRDDHSSSSRFKAMSQTLRIQLRNLLKHYELDNKPIIFRKAEEFIRNNKEGKLVRNLLFIADDLNSMIERSHEINAQHIMRLKKNDRLEEQLKCNTHRSKFNHYRFTWSQKLCLITTQRTDYIMPRPYILLIHNKICDLISVLVLAKAQAGASLPITAEKTVITFIRTLINLHYKFDSKFYKIIKTLEALCIGESIRELDDWDNDEFIITLGKELLAGTGFNYLRSKLRRILISQDTVMRHELCCLSKILGHPLVDMQEGSISLNKKTNEEYTLNPVRIVECTNYMKENYIRNHIVKKGHWPKVSITSSLCPNALKQAWIQDVDPMSAKITRQYGKTKVDHYIFVDIEKRLEFNRLENVLPYLKDKTISLLRSEVISSYIEHNKESSKSSWKETRLLLYYLLNETSVTNHVEFLKKYERSPDFDDIIDYFVLRVVPKEKELKEAFRGFGCQTYYQRMRCLAQEKNAMHYLDLFSDEQAMTLSELELIKKLYALRTITRAYKDHIALYINLDASSWNNHFRKETVDYPMMSFLDKIFDTNIFGKTHKYYEKTLIYVPDEEIVYYWDGQGGGIEGLNQDTWVIDYINQLKISLAGFGYKFHIFVKGDDARIIVLISPKALEIRTMSEIKSEIVKQINKVAAEFGHDIKIDDSYGSCSYFTFSKASAYHTIQYPQTFRKIQKCYGSNNAMLPTLDDYIGSTFSNAHSACHESSNVIPCYWVALFWASWYMSIHPVYKKASNDMLTALLMTPSIVGGFPIIFLHNMFVRAESDLLSPFLDILYFCRDHSPNVCRWMTNFCRLPSHKPNSIIMLCKDPYSLPSDRPELPTAYLRRSIIPILRRSVVNEDVIRLFKAYDSDLTEQTLTCLSSCDRYNPRLMSLIYSCTPAAIIEELVRKFESARSIHELHIMRRARGQADKMLKAVIRREFHLQEWRYLRLQGKNILKTRSYAAEITECPSDSSSRVRYIAWGKLVEGMISPPIAHQIKITSPLQSTDPLWDQQNSFMLNFHLPTKYIPNTNDNVNWSSAGRTPFLGKETSPSHMAPIVNLLDKDPILSKIRTLIELYSWTNVEATYADGSIVTSNIPHLISHLLQCYTKEDISVLQKFGPSKRSGTMQHHLGSPRYRSSIVPNTLSNIYQCFSGDSYHHKSISSATDHFNMNFLYIFCHGVVTTMLETNFSPDVSLPRQIWLVTRKCPHCLEPIRETPIQCDLSKLGSYKPELFFTTKIAKRTMQILKTAIEDYSEEHHKNIPIQANLQVDHACLGIMQEVFDEVKRSQTRLVDRYTQHALGPEGIEVLSNLQARIKTETIPDRILVNIPIPNIVTSIIQLVFFELQEMVDDPDPLLIGTQISMYPINTLPWYHMLDRLYHAGLLAKVIMEMERRSKHPSGTAGINPAHATSYVSHVCFDLALAWSTPLPSIFLSYYSLDRYLTHYRRSLRLTFHAWLRRSFHDIMKECNTLYKSSRTIIEQVHADTLDLLAKYCLLCSVDILDDDYLKEVWDLVKNQTNTLVMFVNLGELDPDIIDSDHFIDQRRKNGFFRKAREMKYLPWTMVLDHLINQWDRLLPATEVYCRQFPIEVINTTKSDCIYVVENLPSNSYEDDDDDNIVHRDLESPRYPIIHPVSSYHGIHLSVPYNRTFGIEPTPSHVAHSWEDSKVILDPSVVYRPLGYTTLVFSRFSEIWSFLKLPQPSTNPHNILVLGDGVGNTSSFMATVCNNSNIYISTLPQGTTTPFVTEMTKTAALAYNCRVFSDHYKKGIYDVLDPRFLPEIRSYCVTFQIVISDIEYPRPNEDNHLSLYTNICKIYLQLRAMNSVFIVQVRLDEPNIVDYVVQKMSRYCDKVGLLRLKSSTRHQQAYIYASGTRDVYIEELFDAPLKCIKTHKAVDAFIRRCDDARLSWVGNRDRGLRIMVDDWQLFKPNFWKLSFRLEYQLYKRFHVNVQLRDTLLKLDVTLPFSVIMKSIGMSWIYVQRNQSLEYLRTSRHPTLRVNHDHLNSHIHVIKEFENVMCCQGFIDTWEYIRLKPDAIITDPMIRSSYKIRIEAAPPRVQVPPFGPKHFRDPLKINEIDSHFFRKYHLGSTLAIEFARLVFHAYKHGIVSMT